MSTLLHTPRLRTPVFCCSHWVLHCWPVRPGRGCATTTTWTWRASASAGAARCCRRAGASSSTRRRARPARPGAADDPRHRRRPSLAWARWGRGGRTAALRSRHSL